MENGLSPVIRPAVCTTRLQLLDDRQDDRERISEVTQHETKRETTLAS